MRRFRIALIPVATLAVVMIGGGLWLNHRFNRQADGVELSVSEGERYLTADLREHFDWSDLPVGSVEHAWERTGFQDPITLFRVRLDPAAFAELRKRVLAKTGSDVGIDDRDDPALCPPPAERTPDWWRVASLKNFDGILWKFRAQAYWFGYASDERVLYLYKMG